QSVVRSYIKASKNVLFEGNGYSDEWKQEAEKRGLNNINEVPEALKAYVNKNSLKLFTDNGVLSHKEVQARYEIMIEKFTKKVQIESRILGDIDNTMIIPSSIKYQGSLVDTVAKMKELGLDEEDYSTHLATVKEISTYVREMKKLVYEM